MEIQDDMLNCIPQFNEEFVVYKREENEGYVSIKTLFPSGASELLINETSKDIIDLCNGENTIIDIVDKMQSIYNGVDRKVLEKDLMNNLLTLNYRQLIIWKNGNPFFNRYKTELDNKYTVELVDAQDVKKVIEFLTSINIEDKDAILYKTPFIYDHLLNDQNLRLGYLGSRQFIFILKDGEEIKGTLGISVPQPTAVGSIMFYALKDSVVSSNEFLNYVFALIPQIYNEVITAYRAHIVENKYENNFEDVLENNGFTNTIVLEDELGRGINVKEYTYALC